MRLRELAVLVSIAAALPGLAAVGYELRVESPLRRVFAERAVEDLLYFARLEKLAKERGDAKVATLCNLTALCPDGMHYPTSPEVVQARREEVARAIEAAER